MLLARRSIHKLSTLLWIKALDCGPPRAPSRPTIRARACSRRSPSRACAMPPQATTGNEGKKKKKKTSFSEDTSCAPPRDVDEEDL